MAVLPIHRKLLISGGIGSTAIVIAIAITFLVTGHTDSSPTSAEAEAVDPPTAPYWLIVTFHEQGPVAMPLQSPSDYLGQEERDDETLFRTRLPDGSVQTYHARDEVLDAYVGTSADRDQAVQEYEARRAALRSEST